MRAGSACAAHQTLSAEAASVLKHSLCLARRRGHAQVTPLHVAATLLSSRASPLRRACLKSQPPAHHQLPHHPLQGRALELCFNVALNRLPAALGPLLAAQPTLSNALVAALKRAQAHQRRGGMEQQQPPLVAIKVDLEQLILSILDDPSVSRVMREAGFSSAAVKSNLEDSNFNSVFQCYNTSGGIYSTPNSPPTETQTNYSTFWQSHLLSCASEQNPLLFSPQKKPNHDFSSLDEDVKVVMEVLLRNNKRKNTVIVGDSLYTAENVVAEMMRKVERGDVPEELKPAHFIKFQFSSVSLRYMKREEIVMNISDLKRKVDSLVSGGGGAIIYTGDLKWTVEIDHSVGGGDDHDEKGDGNSDYKPVDHLIAEMGKLLSWYNNHNNNNNNNNSSRRTRVWLMATANYQTYMKCQMKQPPLDLHWALQAVSVPSGGLGLSLNATSDQNSRFNLVKNPSQDGEKKPFFLPDDEQEVLTCCPECKSNYEKEASFKSIHHKSFSLHSINNDTEMGSAHLPLWLKPHPFETLVRDDIVQLRRKYNKLCQSLHRGSHNNRNNTNSVITSHSYLGRDYDYPSSYSYWPNKSSIFADSDTISFANNHPAVRTNQTASSLPRFRRQQSCHIDFSFSNGSSKPQPVEPSLDSLKGLDDTEVKITLALGNLTYNDHAPTSEKIAQDNDNSDNANLVKFFEENVPWQSENIPSILEALAPGSKPDWESKFLLIKGNDVVGKRRLAVGIAESVFGSSDLLFRTNMRKNARSREMMEKALREHEKLVVLVEDVDHANCELFNFLCECYGRHSSRAIFILTMDGEEKYSHDKSKETGDSVIQMKLLVTNESKLNTIVDHHKRKADWDLPMIKSNKCQRDNEAEQVVSSNALDLNIEADGDQETSKPSSLRFLEKIKNCYVFNRDRDREAVAKEMLLSKLTSSFEEVSGRGTIFSVEEEVLEEVLQGSGLYLNSLFEKWLKQVFETSLRRLGSSERESVRICLEGTCLEEEDGFMGTRLPKSILVSFTG